MPFLYLFKFLFKFIPLILKIFVAKVFCEIGCDSGIIFFDYVLGESFPKIAKCCDMQ